MQVLTPLQTRDWAALCLTLRRCLLLSLPTRLCRTVELGVTITDAAVDGEAMVMFCTLLDDGRRECPGCGAQGVYRDTVIRRVTDVPVVGYPLRPRVRIPRYRCLAADCDREVFAHNTDQLSEATTVMDPFSTSSHWPAASSTCAASASNSSPAGTAGAPAIRSTVYAAPSVPAIRCCVAVKKPDWKSFSLTKTTSPWSCAGASTRA